MHILSPETDNCPSWISGRERMTVENISWSISTKECCRPRRGLNPRPPGLQSDGASNWATEDLMVLLVVLLCSGFRLPLRVCFVSSNCLWVCAFHWWGRPLCGPNMLVIWGCVWISLGVRLLLYSPAEVFFFYWLCQGGSVLCCLSRYT